MKDWFVRFITTNAKTHNSVLLLTAVGFFCSCWRCDDAMKLTAIGGTLAALYGANSYAGTKAPTPPPAAG